MNNDFTSRLSEKRQLQQQQELEQQRQDALLGAVQGSGQNTTAALHDLLLATVVGKDPRMPEVAKNLTELLSGIQQATEQLNNLDISSRPAAYDQLIDAIRSIPQVIASQDRTDEVIRSLQAVADKKIVVPKPQVTVNAPSVDLSPITKKLDSLKVEIPKNDNSTVEKGLQKIDTSIKQLISKPTPVATFPSVIKISDKQGNDILDPTAGYAPSDIDEESDPKYFGFLAADGRWYIMRETGGSEYRYVTGVGEYATNWSNRSALEYGYFSEVF